MSVVNAHPVRVRTTDGWQELALTGPQGPPGPAGGIPGEVKLWPGSALPDAVKYGKWVWADGSSYSSATYPEASANIAPGWKTFGGLADPGAGNFRVPDLRGLIPGGMDQMPGGTRANRVTRAAAITIATMTGSEYYSLAIADLPSHNHGAATGAEAAHTHTVTTGTESADHTHYTTTGGASAGHVHYAGSVNGAVGGWVASTYASGGGHEHSYNSNQAGPNGLPAVDMPYNSGGYIGTIGGGGHTHDQSMFQNYGSGAHQDHSHAGSSGGRSAAHTHSGTTAAGSSHSHSIPAQGGGGAHENMPPTVFVPYIVRLDG
jgi:microcystin-dependent protein